MAFDAGSRGRYATDASIYQIMPLGVVVPKDQEDLALARHASPGTAPLYVAWGLLER